MVTIYDGIAELVDLITTNWNNANTDGKTPIIGDITEFSKEMNFCHGSGYILLYPVSENEEMPGVGLTTRANVTEPISIDIRYTDAKKTVAELRDYFNKVKAELRRILYSNRKTGTTNYDILNLDNQDIRNLSDRSRKYYREVRQVTIRAFNRDMVN